MMDIDAFPEIENFQKLPRQVIVKAGNLSMEPHTQATLQGIVINNTGHGIRNVRVHVVIFGENKMPVLSTSQTADPDVLPQGGMANFTFQFQDNPQAIKDFHLYTRWRFDEQE